MALEKLDLEQQKVISEQITKLKDLNQIAIARGAKGYMYDWAQLNRALKQATLEYEHIILTDELFV